LLFILTERITHGFEVIKREEMLDTTTNSAKQETRILAAANRLRSLDYVGLYTIMLAKRTGMIACLLFVLNENEKEEGEGKEEYRTEFQDKIRMIQDAGMDADVRVDYIITTGSFAEEVAKYLKVFDSPILVVGEGPCKEVRKEELQTVRKILIADGSWQSNRSRQFLIVSGKHKVAAIGKDTSLTDWITNYKQI
jgi:hypothetical protein